MHIRGCVPASLERARHQLQTPQCANLLSELSDTRVAGGPQNFDPFPLAIRASRAMRFSLASALVHGTRPGSAHGSLGASLGGAGFDARRIHALVPAADHCHGGSAQALLAGDAAAASEASSDEQLAACALGVLRTLFPSAPDPVGCTASRWTSDPWSRGSYSYVALGASAADYQTLAAPLAAG